MQPATAERIREHVERLTKIRHPSTGPVGLAEAADHIRCSYTGPAPRSAIIHSR